MKREDFSTRIPPGQAFAEVRLLVCVWHGTARTGRSHGAQGAGLRPRWSDLLRYLDEDFSASKAFAGERPGVAALGAGGESGRVEGVDL